MYVPLTPENRAVKGGSAYGNAFRPVFANAKEGEDGIRLVERRHERCGFKDFILSVCSEPQR